MFKLSDLSKFASRPGKISGEIAITQGQGKLLKVGAKRMGNADAESILCCDDKRFRRAHLLSSAFRRNHTPKKP